jgi:uncharacterized SAM-binding protein YcdF (DUF218 family)
MTTNYLLWLFVKPSHWVLMAAVLGVVLWRAPLGGTLRRLAAVLVVVFGLLPTAALLMRPLETRFPLPSDVERVDGIVVLAGAEERTLTALHGQPQLNSMGDRLTTFLMLAERYPDARLVHSGAFDSVTARLLLENIALDGRRLHFEDLSANTCDSARVLREQLQPSGAERWLVVTSAFHLPRTVACFRAVDWNVIPYPADYRRGPSLFAFALADNLEDLDLAAHEWLGLLYYRLRGDTRELFPAP